MSKLPFISFVMLSLMFGFVSCAQESVPVTDHVARGIFGVELKDLDSVANHGFNVVHSYYFKSKIKEDEAEPFREVEAFLDEAWERKLQVLLSIPGKYSRRDNEKSDELIKSYVETLKDHPGLYGWYLFDEPNEKKITPERLRRVYRMVKRKDSVHLIFVSNWEPMKYRNGYDVDMRQLYQGRASLMDNTLDGGLLYRKRMQTLGKPWVAIVNTHDPGFGVWEDSIKDLSSPVWFYSKGAKNNRARAPEVYKAAVNRAKVLNENRDDPFHESVKNTTGEEFKMSPNFPNSPEVIHGQVISSFCHGSNAIFFWTWSDPGDSIHHKEGYYTVFHYKKTENAIREINDVIRRFDQFLIHPNTDEIGDEGNLAYRFIDHEKGQLLMLVNESKKPFTGQLPVEGFGLKSESFKNMVTGKMVNLQEELTIEPDHGLVLIHRNGSD